jgi:hypothetical protein
VKADVTNTIVESAFIGDVHSAGAGTDRAIDWHRPRPTFGVTSALRRARRPLIRDDTVDHAVDRYS